MVILVLWEGRFPKSNPHLLYLLNWQAYSLLPELPRNPISEKEDCISAPPRGTRVFLIAQMVKNPPVMKDTWINSLGQEGPLDREMATHFSILAWKTHGWRSLMGYIIGLQRVRYDWATNIFIFTRVTSMAQDWFQEPFSRTSGKAAIWRW